MITFLYSVFITALVFYLWYAMADHIIAMAIGREKLGKEEFNKHYEENHRVLIEFLKMFNPNVVNINKRAEAFAAMLVAATILAPIFTIGSLIALFV